MSNELKKRMHAPQMCTYSAGYSTAYRYQSTIRAECTQSTDEIARVYSVCTDEITRVRIAEIPEQTYRRQYVSSQYSDSFIIKSE